MDCSNWHGMDIAVQHRDAARGRRRDGPHSGGRDAVESEENALASRAFSQVSGRFFDRRAARVPGERSQPVMQRAIHAWARRRRVFAPDESRRCPRRRDTRKGTARYGARMFEARGAAFS